MKRRRSGLVASIEHQPGRPLTVRFQCPWCGENSNVAHQQAIQTPDSRAAFLVICEGGNCRRPVMVTAQFYSTTDGGRSVVDGLFPSQRMNYKPDGVPDDIAADFEEALNCQAAGFNLGAATVGRRTLQAALLDKGAKKRDLVDQINELPDDILSHPLKVAAQHVRLIGNDAAHVRAVSADDVASLVDFVELLLEQLYVLPHEIERQTRRIPPQHMPGGKPPS
jgi:hypothetical protein